MFFFCCKKPFVKQTNPNMGRRLEDLKLASELARESYSTLRKSGLNIRAYSHKDKSDGRFKCAIEVLQSPQQTEEELKDTIFKLCPELARHDGGLVKIIFNDAKTFYSVVVEECKTPKLI